MKPGTARTLATVVMRVTFQEAAEQLERIADILIAEKETEAAADMVAKAAELRTWILELSPL